MLLARAEVGSSDAQSQEKGHYSLDLCVAPWPRLSKVIIPAVLPEVNGHRLANLPDAFGAGRLTQVRSKAKRGVNPSGVNVVSKTQGALLTAAERKEKALEYRKMGYSFAAIGKLVGCTPKRVHDIVSDYLRELNQKNSNSAEELRQLELEKLDDQERRLTAAIVALMPDRIALLPRLEDSLLRVRVQRSKLLGLVVPTQVLVPVDTRKGRVEEVVSDPRVVELVDEAKSWEPPRLAITAPREQVG